MTSSSQYAVVNPFGGDTRIAIDGSYFSIIYEDISKNACITLATMDWGSSYSSGFIGLAAGSRAIYSSDWKNVSLYSTYLTKYCDSEYSNYYGGSEFCAKKYL